MDRRRPRPGGRLYRFNPPLFAAIHSSRDGAEAPPASSRPVQLSILLPTHRDDLTALSRIAQACSWAGPSIEVIVRDNSGSARKRSQIAQFKRDHCTIVSAEPCGPLENFSEAMRLAR